MSPIPPAEKGELNCEIDTGADCSLILGPEGKRRLEAQGLEMRPPRSQDVFAAADGRPIPAEGEFEVWLGGSGAGGGEGSARGGAGGPDPKESFRVVATVADLLTHSVLGNEFFETYKCKISYLDRQFVPGCSESSSTGRNGPPD